VATFNPKILYRNLLVYRLITLANFYGAHGPAWQLYVCIILDINMQVEPGHFQATIFFDLNRQVGV